MLEINEVYPQIYLLRVPVPLDIKYINAYLFTGEVPTLIDAGCKGADFCAEIRDTLRHLGIPRLKQIVLSHWHVDHGGGAAALAAAEGAEIFITARDYAEWIKCSRPERFDDLQDYMFHSWGVPEQEIRQMSKFYTYLQGIDESPEAVSYIEPGVQLEAGNYRLQVLGTPGHTPGHVSFVLAEAGLLFGGDHLLPNQIPYPAVWVDGGKLESGMPSYLKSLDVVAAAGCSRYFPAHGAPAMDPTARCQEVAGQMREQIANHVPADTVYLGAVPLLNGRSEFLFYDLHIVFGWEEMQRLSAGRNPWRRSE